MTVGVGATRTLRLRAGRASTPPGQGYMATRPTIGHKQPRTYLTNLLPRVARVILEVEEEVAEEVEEVPHLHLHRHLH